MDVYDALLAPPDDLPPDPGLPDEIPEWVVCEALLSREPSCDCCGGAHVVDPGEPAWLIELLGEVVDSGADRLMAGGSGGSADGASEDGLGWATPGVTGLDRPSPESVLPSPSPVVQALLDAVARVEAVDPTGSPGAQALVDAQALLGVEQRLRVLDLRRIGDVKARGLAEQAGFTGANAWLREHRPDGGFGDASLAVKLRDHPTLSAAVTDGSCSLRAARQVVKALRQCGPHLDQPDGRIDGQPGDAVVNAVIAHVATVLCREVGGLHDNSPRLAQIVARAEALAALVGQVGSQVGGGVSQLAVLEQAFTWLAQDTGPRVLASLLDELVMCVLPSELEERDKRGRAKRALSLELQEDGNGWHLEGDLTLEAGERLWVALRAMATGDPANPEDTKAWEQARAAGMVDADEIFGPLGQALAAQGQLLPRAKKARLHDAFNLLLEKFLDAGLGGMVGKAPVQIHVTIAERTLTDHTGSSGPSRSSASPGAPPPRADSGALIPRGMVRRWWTDCNVSAFVLSLGGKALRVVHGQRTLTGDERRALTIEGGGRCLGEGCCPAHPDPLVPLRPHHVLGYAEDQVTSLEDTVPACDNLHQDLHVGKRVIRTRDGRWLDENGYRDAPDLFDNPPF